MGFGILFIGYILTFVLSIASYGCVFSFVGYLVMLFALTKLWEYNGRFKYAFFAALPLLLISAYDVFVMAAGMMGVGYINPDVLKNSLPYVEIILELAYHGTLALALAAIASDTELNTIRANAVRDYVLYILYFAIAAISIIPPVLTSSVGRYFTMAAFVAELFCIALFAILIFSCYRNICDESDVNMSAKVSRFGFVNKIRAEYNQKEEKAREADRLYKQERAQRKKNKRK